MSSICPSYELNFNYCVSFQVPKAAWDFLHSVYGGKPVLPVDEA